MLTVGRDPNCDININSSFISQQHAIIRIHANGQVDIVDKSTNGTFVNGMRLRKNVPTHIMRQDVVSFARVSTLDWNRVLRQPTSYQDYKEPVYYHPQYSISQPVYHEPVVANNIQDSESSNVMGLTGFILSLLGLIFIWVPILSFILWILGLIFSILGISKKPNSLAIAGLIISGATLLLFIIFIIYWASFLKYWWLWH